MIARLALEFFWNFQIYLQRFMWAWKCRLYKLQQSNEAEGEVQGSRFLDSHHYVSILYTFGYFFCHAL